MHADLSLPAGLSRDPAADYARIARVIDFIRAEAKERRQPSLREIAGAAHASEFHLQRLFSRWAGLSPKRFLQLLTLENAKERLARSADLLSATFDAGLSSPGRLHDLFVHVEAVTPGEFKTGGAGLRIRHGFHPTPFGECLVGATQRGVCFLEFRGEEPRRGLLARLARSWPGARLEEAPEETGELVRRIFSREAGAGASLSLLVKGTNFQTAVWRALLRVPPGHVVSYARLAEWIGAPGAARAIGAAVGANPVAWLIPCHRVLRGDGSLGGYHWGETRKAAALAWEQAVA